MINMYGKKGIIVAFSVAIISFIINILLSLEVLGNINIGGSTIALLLGSLAAYYFSDIEIGGRWIINKILPITIILLGFGLNLTSFLDPKIGLVGVVAAFATAVTSFAGCYFIGKYMGIDLRTTIALGTGGAICGNSAVIAVSPGLGLKENRVGIVLAIINILGLITFFLVPFLSSFLGLTDEQSGIWAGSVIHAVPQAIAAGENIGGEALGIATAIKLSRVSLLVIMVPLCLYIGNRMDNVERSGTEIVDFPYFIPGFIISSFMATFLLPNILSSFLAIIGKYLLLPLLASVGFFITKDSMKEAGGSVFVLGIITTIMMMMISYATIIMMS